MPTLREQRRHAIVELMHGLRLRSQAELAEHLEGRGFSVNQATLSRDLRDLGVRKGPEGYELPRNGRPADPTGALVRAIEEWLLTATPAQNLLVLKTPPGGAQPLALALDRAAPPEVVGTVAGDDTVLVVCPHGREALRFRRWLLKVLEERT